MAIEIVWTQEATSSFEGNIDYLLREWSEKEVINFVEQTATVLKRLEIFPESYPIGKLNKSYRKAKINRHIVLFYRFRKTSKKIVLLTFWNVKRDPNTINL